MRRLTQGTGVGLMSEKQPCIYCPACGEEHPWLDFLKGQEFQCACGHVLNMPIEPPSSPSMGMRPTGSQTGSTYSLDALVNPGAGNAPSSQVADDSDELEVIEDDDLEVIEEDDSAGDEDLYELSVDVNDKPRIPPSSSTPAANESGSFADVLMPVADPAPHVPSKHPTPNQGMTRCPYCKEQYPFRLTHCPQCGRDEMGNRDPKHKKDKKDDAQLHLMGIAMTLKNISILAGIFLVLGYTCYWILTGPAAKFRYYDMQIVDGVILMQTDIQTRGNVLEGFNDVNGEGVTKAGNETLYNDAGYLAVGTHFDLYAVKENKNGQYVLLDVAIQQSMLENNNSRSAYDMLLISLDYKLKSGSNEIPGMILAEQLPNQFNLILGAANTSDIRKSYIPEMVPEEIDWPDYSRLPLVGKLTFTGAQGLAGTITFRSHAQDRDAIGANGMTINGNLQYSSPSGLKAVYAYNGSDMTLNVDNSCQVYRSIVDEKVKASWSPWHQYRFKLIFKRPAPGKYDVMYANNKVMSIKVP